MKKVNLKFLPFICLMFLFSTSACQRIDYGPLQEEIKSYTLTGFDKVQIGDASKVYISQGANFSIQVKGDRRNLDDLEVKVEGNKLIAEYKNYRKRKHPNEYTIVMPTLKGVDFSGAVFAKVEGFLETESFEAKLSGASELRGDVQTLLFKADFSGASQATFSGVAKRVEAHLSGAAKLHFFGVEAEDVFISVSGGSEGYVKANKTLEANASGGSKVRFRGNPTVSSQVSGGSSVLRD